MSVTKIYRKCSPTLDLLKCNLLEPARIASWRSQVETFRDCLINFTLFTTVFTRRRLQWTWQIEMENRLMLTEKNRCLLALFFIYHATDARLKATIQRKRMIIYLCSQFRFYFVFMYYITDMMIEITNLLLDEVVELLAAQVTTQSSSGNANEHSWRFCWRIRKDPIC